MGYNFAQVVDTIAADSPERMAVLCVDTDGHEEVVTYNDLRQLTNSLAQGLRTLGIRQGDKVLVLLPRCTESFLVYLSLLKIGATVMPGSEMLRADDIRYRINHAGAVAVIAHVSLAYEIEMIKGECETLGHCIAVDGDRDGWTSLNSLFVEGNDEEIHVETNDDDICFLLYTSGTTGRPKGVMHNYAWAREHLRIAGTHWFDAKPGEIVWATAAPGWGKWIWSPFVSALGNGATTFLYKGRFHAKKYLKLMQQYKIRLLCATPTEYRLMAKVDNLASYQLHLRSAVSAGEALNREVVDRFYEAFHVVVRDGYGQTESSLVIGNLQGIEIKRGAIGKPYPGMKIAILDDEGRELPHSKVGNIAVHKTFPGLFEGYLNDEKRTNNAFLHEWFITGDQGYTDESGYFYFHGRSDDIIISSGYTIGPSEVEDALVKHPKVIESAVIASPDPERGHIVKAFIVLRDPNDKSNPNLIAELQNHVRSLTAPYKYPRVIEFVQSLPKTTSGKIQRVVLRNLEEER